MHHAKANIAQFFPKGDSYILTAPTDKEVSAYKEGLLDEGKCLQCSNASEDHGVILHSGIGSVNRQPKEQQLAIQ
jgi:hypothetical protein